VTRRIAVALTAVLTAGILAGCGGDDSDDTATSTPPATTAPQTTTSAPAAAPTTEDDALIRGRSEEAVKATINAFVPKWGSYSPWDPGDTKSEYFTSWQDLATDAYGLQQYRAFDGNWSWTWTDEVKAYGAKATDIGPITVTGDRAVASHVTVTRHLLPVLGRLSDDKTETKIYRIELAVSDTDHPKVSNVVSLGPTNAEDKEN
jgi:hypothetical protein